MFRLERVRLENWCQHRQFEADFVKGTNCIIGTNGKGKSNLMAGVFAGITGGMMADSIEDNINFEADTATVDVDCVSNNRKVCIRRDFTAKRKQDGGRDATKTKSRLVIDNGDPITGAHKVNDAIADVIGITQRVISDHVFIAQGKLDELLFQPRSKRLDSFMKLIPSVEAAEYLRSALAVELSKYPETVVSQSIEDMSIEVDATAVEIRDLMTVRETMKADHDDCKAAAVTAADVMRMHADAVKSAAERERVTARISELNARLSALRADVPESGAAVSMDDLNAAVAARAELASRAAAIASGLASNRRRECMMAELTDLRAELASLSEPDDRGKPWDDLDDMVATMDQMKAELAACRAVINKPVDDDVCPTCKRPYGSDDEHRAHIEAAKIERDNAIATATGLESNIAALKSGIDALSTARSEYSKAVAVFTSKRGMLTGQISKLAKDIDSITVMPECTAEAELDVNSRLSTAAVKLAGLQRMAADYEAKQAVIRAHANEISQINGQLSAMSARVAELDAALADAPGLDAVNAADIVLADLKRIEGKIATIDAEISAHKAVYADRQNRLRDAIKLKERCETVNKYRGVLESARHILHRENLPSAVLSNYAGQLEAMSNKFLAYFGTPFSVAVSPDMELTCTMPSGYRPPAHRLSGGQKCVLSVVFRFAINELFARDVGMLVLDEPTAFMDDDNISYIGYMMQRIQQISAETGVQTVVITHAKELVAAFENVIQV